MMVIGENGKNVAKNTRPISMLILCCFNRAKKGVVYSESILLSNIFQSLGVVRIKVVIMADILKAILITEIPMLQVRIWLVNPSIMPSAIDFLKETRWLL